MPQTTVSFGLAELLYGEMKDRGAVAKVLLFLTFSLRPSSAVNHTLEYKWTGYGEPVRNFTSVGLLDGEEFMYYDDSTAEIIQTEWIKELESDLPAKERETWDVEGQQDWLRSRLSKVQAKVTGGDTLQRVYGCEIDDNGVTRGYDKSIYNGTDFISLDLNTGTWTAVDERAKSFTEGWNPEKKTAGFWKDFLEDMCVARLKRYKPYSTRKEPAGRSEGGAEGRSDLGTDGGADAGKTAVTVAVVLVAVLAVAAAVGFVIYKMKLCAHLRGGYVAARQSPKQ